MVRRRRMKTTTYVELDEPESTTSHSAWVQAIAALPEPQGGRFDALKDVARKYAFLSFVHDRPDRRDHWPK